MTGFALCAAAAVFFGLIAASIPGIVEAQQTRDRLRAVPVGQDRMVSDPEAGMKIGVSDIMVAETRRWRRVFVYDVRDPAQAATPPGVDHAPRPGEVFLSPAAAQLIASNPRYATWAPGRQAGLIGPAGLAHPDELFAYVGRGSNVPEEPNLDVTFGVSPTAYRITPDRSGELWETSWSQGTMQYLDSEAILVRLIPAILIPVAALTLAALGMSSRVYRRRWLRAHLAGMPRALIGRVAAWEGAVAGLVGGAAGCLAAALLWPPLGTAGVPSLSWYPQDAALPLPFLVGAVAFSTLVFAAMSAVSAVRSIRTSAQVRRRAQVSWALLTVAVLAWVLAAVPLAEYKGMFGQLAPDSLLARVYSPQVSYLLMTIAVGVTIVSIEPIMVALSRLVRPRHMLSTRLAARFVAGNRALAPRLVAVPMVLISLLGLHAGSLDAATEVKQVAYGADGLQSVGIDGIKEPLKQRFLASPSVAPYAKVTRHPDGAESLDIVFPRRRADDVMSDIQTIMPELKFERGMVQTIQQRAQLFAVLLPVIFVVGLVFSMPMLIMGVADALRGDSRFARSLDLIGAPRQLIRSAMARALAAVVFCGIVVAGFGVAVNYNVVYIGALYGTELQPVFGFPVAYVLGGGLGIAVPLWLCLRIHPKVSALRDRSPKPRQGANNT
ncbi:hypothetical protein ACFY05_39785 [Microtetraspora fusca]|uniref:FtsX-like permease family protein n=1 Tax=Microtetraspora fusca TaxID=1997 RepID=A0ABW6VHZ8_MICFU